MSSDRWGGVWKRKLVRPRLRKMTEWRDGENPRVNWKRESERLAQRECSAMDKVMNEEIHLAEKKARAMGRSLLKGEPKKTKNEDSEKYVRQRASRSEWNAVWQRATARRGEGSKRQTERDRERKKICSNSLWMCSGASAIPQPIGRLCSHYSTVKQRTVRTEKWRGIPGEMFTHWVAPALPVAAGRQGGDVVLLDPWALYTTEQEDCVQTEPLCRPARRPGQCRVYS